MWTCAYELVSSTASWTTSCLVEAHQKVPAAVNRGIHMHTFQSHSHLRLIYTTHTALVLCITSPCILYKMGVQTDDEIGTTTNRMITSIA